jgi:hypothetical protein
MTVLESYSSPELVTDGCERIITPVFAFEPPSSKPGLYVLIASLNIRALMLGVIVSKIVSLASTRRFPLKKLDLFEKIGYEPFRGPTA